ncbi:MAG: PEP-CTERM sorting domain-containing protein [Sedimentisphaerales bacterium]
MKRIRFSKMLSILAAVILLVAVLAPVVRADFVDNFDGRSLGAYIGQAPEWHHYSDTPGIFQSPVVGTAAAFSGTKSLNNSDDGSAGGAYGWMEAYTVAPETGHDVTVSFMFKRTAELGEMNKIRLDIYNSAKNNRAAAAIYSNRLYDENNSWNMIESVAINTWYKLVMKLTWNAGTNSYGNSAMVQIWNDDLVHLLGQSTVTIQSGNLNDVGMIRVMMRQNGATNAFVDDLSITGATIPEPATMSLLVLGGIALLRRIR